MGTGFNQIVSISGGPGTTSVQHIDYDPITHTLTLVKANGTSTPVTLKDSHLESAVINGDKLTFSIGDMTHGLVDTIIDLDISTLTNAAFATQVETDAGVLSDVIISPAMLKAWLANEVKANQPTPSNAGKFVPLDADGKIDPKWMHHMSVTDVHVAGDKAALDALVPLGTVGTGDVGIATANNKSYIYDGSSWVELLTPTDAVLSVAGKTGAVVLNLDDIAETASRLHIAPGNVLGDMLSWNPTAGVNGEWESHTPHSLEVGGKAFKPNAAYEAGDIVDNGNHVYARIAAGGEATWDLTKWQIADSSGRLHSDASKYLVGDIVSYGGALYINSAAITTAKPWNPADWTEVKSGENDLGKPTANGQILSSTIAGVRSWITPAVGGGSGGTNGTDGKGWTGATYDSATGIVAFASTDGLGFLTGDIRGSDGAQGVSGGQGIPGLQGIPGIVGKDGKDGTDGTNGTGVTIKGSDTNANILTKAGAIGDMWIDSATGNGWVSDGNTGPASWVNVGPIKGPQGVQGVQGVQGIDGVGINVLPPVPDAAARTALSTSWTATDAGKSVLQIDTGDFWTYDGTKWVDAGHLVGPQGTVGLQGIKGLDGTIGTTGVNGKDGADGKDGTGVTIRGSDTNANILTKAGAAGDMWLDTATGHGWVSDGGGTGAAHWTDVGSIQGPQGIQGVQGIQGLEGDKGDKGDGFTGKIINNLTAGGTTDVLSAQQGKVLKGLADTNKIDIAAFIAQKAAASGLATLDGNQKLTPSQLPNFTVSQVYVVPDIAGRDGLNTGAAASNGGIDTGDIVVVTNIAQGTGVNVHETWMAKTDGANSPTDWVEISAPSVMPVKSDWNETGATSLAYIENKPSIINTLASTSITNILSANQGKVLNDKIISLESRIATLEALVLTFMPKSGGTFTGSVTMASGKTFILTP